jgi:hypothetical protein
VIASFAMRVLPVLAVVLAAAALVVGILALTGDDGGFEQKTLSLIEETENEKPLDVGRGPALVFSSAVSGDETGELAGTCMPVGEDGIACETTFFLPGGTITTQNARLGDQTEITSPIIGGTGDYEGALGTHSIPDPDSSEHTLELLIPEA